MERQLSREPTQPIPLLQTLPNGQLAYISLPIPSAAGAPTQPLAAHTSVKDLTGKRDLWALIVQIAGVLMLIGGSISVLVKVCAIDEIRAPHQFAFWAVSFVTSVLMLAAGVLGVQAGTQKTAETAQRYQNFLLFFAVLFVLVTGSAICFFMHHELRHMDKHQERNEANRALPQYYAKQDKSMTSREANSEALETHCETTDCPSAYSDENSTEAIVYFEGQEINKKTSDAYAGVPQHLNSSSPQEASNTEATALGSSRRIIAKQRWNRQDWKRGLFLSVGVGMLLTATLCSGCVFCACRLVKYTEKYEALFLQENVVLAQGFPSVPFPQCTGLWPLAQAVTPSGFYPDFASTEVSFRTN